MTPNRRRILERYVALGNAKAVGVNYSLLRRYIREACDEFGCGEPTLPLYLVATAPRPVRRRHIGALPVQLLDLSEA